MSKLNQIISRISELNPIHLRKLNKSLNGLGPLYQQRAEGFLTKYEALLQQEGKTLHFATDCYLKMLADINYETLRFHETGQYSSKSFEEVNHRVYGNPEVMEYYMHALLLSQFLWKHHYEMFCFFTEEVSKRKERIKHYLEIGGGHGLQVAEARNILGPSSTFTVVDISSTSLDLARKLVNDPSIEFILCDIFKFSPEKKYDFITLGEVLEHMEDPRSLLESVSGLLADDGILFITTPANAPTIDHIYLFRNEDDIRNLLRSANYRIESEFFRYAEDCSKEVAEKRKITLHYGASLSKVKLHKTQ